MKISKLLAVAALACAAALFVSPSAFAATADPVAGPILGYEDIAYPAVCAVMSGKVDELIAPAMTECSSPGPMSTFSHSFVLATLRDPVSIYDLPLYVHFDPGRVGAAVT